MVGKPTSFIWIELFVYTNHVILFWLFKVSQSMNMWSVLPMVSHWRHFQTLAYFCTTAEHNATRSNILTENPGLYPLNGAFELRHNAELQGHRHIVLSNSQCWSIIKNPWCNWQHTFWHVTSIHRQRRFSKALHTPFGASFLLSLYKVSLTLFISFSFI